MYLPLRATKAKAFTRPTVSHSSLHLEEIPPDHSLAGSPFLSPMVVIQQSLSADTLTSATSFNSAGLIDLSLAGDTVTKASPVTKIL